jgi:hypothetical protein
VDKVGEVDRIENVGDVDEVTWLARRARSSRLTRLVRLIRWKARTQSHIMLGVPGRIKYSVSCPTKVPQL